MGVVDFIDLSDDEDTVIVKDHAAQMKCSAKVEVKFVDLTAEEDFVEDQHAYGRDATITLCKQEFVAAVDANEEAMQSGNQVLVAASGSIEEAVQSDFVAVGHVTEEATLSGNRHFVAASDSIEEAVAAGDGTGEATLSGNQHFVAASDGIEEAVAAADATKEATLPGNRHFVASSDGIEEAVAAADGTDQAMQSEDAATTSSAMTEQGAMTSSSMTEQLASTSPSTIEQWSKGTAAFQSFPPTPTASPCPRQFWKAGEYSVASKPAINNGQNRLRIHPKFLHSNATSHKWAFGAIAELLDNAVDEVHNGATFVKIYKMKYSLVGEYALVIQDDGGGMSPESLRHCLSFGFSSKCGNSSIGQYGNGFKTSTMRLGADAIVFTCKQDDRRLTRSVGLLSYTFLTRTGCNDTLVPVVDYEFDASSRTFKKLMNHGEKHFSSNLSTLLRWSPFPTEDDLLNQFGDIGCHGTKIIIFNLWFNDAWEMELDFTTDEEDIMISGAPAIPDERKTAVSLKHMHVARRFRYSLRVYASILYLHLPKYFQIILCGRVVEPHHIANDLIYCECIKYRPQIGALTQVDVITTIGYLRGAPKLDFYGFNVYHKNRLILPFWPAGSLVSNGRGISGVLEANFIRPTHDKQGFEKTGLFNRLETRLKDMAIEYWRHHAHLVGYGRVTKTLPPAYFVSTDAQTDGSLAARATTKNYAANSRARGSVVLEPSSSGEPSKRRSCSTIDWRAPKRQNINDYADQHGRTKEAEMAENTTRDLTSQNKMLTSECSEYEATAPQLRCKADELRNEILQWKKAYTNLHAELKFYNGLSALQRDLHQNNSSAMWF